MTVLRKRYSERAVFCDAALVLEFERGLGSVKIIFTEEIVVFLTDPERDIFLYFILFNTERIEE